MIANRHLLRGRMPPDKITASELARFLQRLSDMYRDPATGNPALSEALADLAAGLKKRRSGSIRDKASGWAMSSGSPPPLLENETKNLSPDDVRKFVSDNNRSKTELIELGSIRFGIPRSRLVKMNKADVAEAIGFALRNEESLKIISKQAQRGGRTRSS